MAGTGWRYGERELWSVLRAWPWKFQLPAFTVSQKRQSPLNKGVHLGNNQQTGTRTSKQEPELFLAFTATSKDTLETSAWVLALPG